MGLPTFLASLADAYGRVGQPANGLDILGEAYATVERSGERWSEAELYQLEGELTLKLSGTERTALEHRNRAEKCFLQAQKIAHDRKAKLVELRATVSLHRLQGTLGGGAEALRLLKEIYGSLTEGFKIPDVVEAAELIEAKTC